jgi:hypothetical protein
MVTDIGDDASWNVSAADVGTALGIAHSAGYDRVWIAGGWGVDALVGRQTRIHSDLDLAVDVTQMALDHLLQAFGRHGYAVEADWRPSRVALVGGGAHARSMFIQSSSTRRAPVGKPMSKVRNSSGIPRTPSPRD